VNSYINDIIGDGVDRMSEIMSTYRNKQQNELMKSSFDFEKRKQNINSSINLSLDNKSSQIISNDYSNKKRNLFKEIFYYYCSLIDWNLVSNEINFDQQKVLDKNDLLQDQEPYSNMIKIHKRVNNQIL
jgi:hypothetical protein